MVYAALTLPPSPPGGPASRAGWAALGPSSMAPPFPSRRAPRRATRVAALVPSPLALAGRMAGPSQPLGEVIQGAGAIRKGLYSPEVRALLYVLGVPFIPLCMFPQADGAKQAAEWVEKLRSERIEEREEAVQRLREWGKPALPLLDKATRDADAELAARAARLLEVITIDLSVTPRLRKLRADIADRILAKDAAVCARVFLEAAEREKNPEINREDLEPLALLAFQGARVEQTSGTWNETRPWHQGYGDGGRVARTIVEFDLRSAVPAIEERLGDRSFLAATLALETLARLRTKETAPALLPLLRGPHSSISDCRGCRTAEVLREFEAKSLITRVQELLTEDQDSARIHAIEALSLLDPAGTPPSAIRLLKDKEPDVRKHMLGALGRLKAKEAIPDVEAALKDSQTWVRYEAAETLALLGARDSAPAIARLLNEPEKMVRARALESLGELGAVPLVPDIERSLDDSEREVREAAVLALARLEARGSVPRLVRMLKGQDYWTRVAIVEALGRLGATREIPALFDLLRDTDRCKEWDTCHWKSAGEALLRQDARAVIREGARYLVDPNLLLRKRASELFARLNLECALPEILKLMQEGDPNVRVPLATLACRFGSRRGAPILLEAAAGGKADLGALNALRRPEAWKRLSCELPLTISLGFDVKRGKEDRISLPSFRGTAESLWREAGTMAGLPVDLPPREQKKGSEPDATLEILNHQGWTTLVDLLRESLGAFEYILEDDRIRILPRQEALAFWREWSSEKK